MFDEQPDGDPHGECAAEIHRLEAENAKLVAELRNASALQAARMPEVPCWLVEKRAEGRTVGFLGHALGTSEWFPTADRATRFVRREDANGVAECFEFEDVIIAEHIWG